MIKIRVIFRTRSAHWPNWILQVSGFHRLRCAVVLCSSRILARMSIRKSKTLETRLRPCVAQPGCGRKLEVDLRLRGCDSTSLAQIARRLSSTRRAIGASRDRGQSGTFHHSRGPCHPNCGSVAPSSQGRPERAKVGRKGQGQLENKEAGYSGRRAGSDIVQQATGQSPATGAWQAHDRLSAGKAGALSADHGCRGRDLDRAIRRSTGGPMFDDGRCMSSRQPRQCA